MSVYEEGCNIACHGSRKSLYALEYGISVLPESNARSTTPPHDLNWGKFGLRKYEVWMPIGYHVRDCLLRVPCLRASYDVVMRRKWSLDVIDYSLKSYPI